MEPKSQNIAKFEVQSFLITCALWENSMGGKSYEIGIRNNSINQGEPGHFRLVQSQHFHRGNIIFFGALIKRMLLAGMKSIDIQNYFSSAEDDEGITE